MGYTGGKTPAPTGNTLGDHTECVNIGFDPTETTYSELLKMFWKNHDSTKECTREYMSAIFYHDAQQKFEAEQCLISHQARLTRSITTQILPAQTFFEAEGYHQKYILQKHPRLLNMLDMDPSDLVESTVAARLNGYLGGYGSIEAFDEEAEHLGLSLKEQEYIRRVMKTGTNINC